MGRAGEGEHMAVWSEGYFTDVQYTAHPYPHMAPGYLRIAALLGGVRPPELGEGPAYLELGCGQGFNLNLLAAGNPQISFTGVDFHPGQIANAQRLAKAAGLRNVTFEDFSFAQMLEMPAEKLPRVDVVALHGVLSWVSLENRARIIRIIDRVLKPGGLVYVSYNCLPGWNQRLVLRRLLLEQFERQAGSPEARLEAAIKTATRMADAESGFFRPATGAKQTLAHLATQTPAYLFHEYMNADYHAFFHADVVREMEGARLSFAASAIAAEDVPSLAAPEALQPLVAEAQDETWRQTVFDFANNKPFRRDVFVRGRNALSPDQQLALLSETPLTLLVRPEEAKLTFQVPLGTLTGDPTLYGPIVEALADAPKTYGELLELKALTSSGKTELQLRHAIMVMLAAGYIHPAQDVARDSARAFNRTVLEGLEDGERPPLVSAVAGAPIGCNLAESLGLRAAFRKQSVKSAAAEGAAILAKARAAFMIEGKVVSDPAEVTAEFVRRIDTFRAEKLPLWERIGVA
jgi:SAM-dependent methyltransferase